MNIIPYGRQEITEEDINNVVQVLKSDFLTQGPVIEEFEKKFASYIGAKYAVAVANGTAALHLAVLALGIKPGKKVITTPITFVASANAVLYAGGKVDFCDIDPETGLMDLDLLEKKISADPEAYCGVIPVDFAGKVVDTERMKKIIGDHKIWILQDASHSPGGFFINTKGEKVKAGSNTYTDASTFSFHPVKHIACGEGGMVTTADIATAEKINLLRTHGITKNPDALQANDGGWYYEMQELGFNYRLSDIHAALGVSQLSRIDKNLIRRLEVAEKYRNALKDLPLEMLTYNEGDAYHLFVIKTKRRKELYEYLRSKDIYSQVHYIPMHLQPYYQSLGFSSGDYPVSEDFYNKILSIPMFHSLSDEEQSYVIEKIKEFFK